jgi:hypothetical protein
LADRDEGEGELPARLIQCDKHPLPALPAQVAANCGLEDDRQSTGLPFGKELRKTLDDVALLQLGRVGPQRLDGTVEPLESGGLVRPDEGLEEQRVVGACEVERREIDPSSPADMQDELEQAGRNGSSFLAGQNERGVVPTPRPVLIAVAIAIPDEVEAGTRAELEQVEHLDAGPASDLEEARQQHPAALYLIRLDAVLLDKLPQPLRPLREHRDGIAPGIDSLAQRKVVKPTEKLEGAVPARIDEDLPDGRLSGESTTHVGVQLRAIALALLRLVEKRLLELVGGQLSWRVRPSPARRSR